MQAVTRYDTYNRRGPKVFAGEFACHTAEREPLSPENRNTFEAALYEAALMTGIERNADVVHMATYAPLFAHREGWQWRPDLIWFDNLSSVRTPNWYVQQLYATHRGTNVLSLKDHDGKAVTGQQGLCASAVYDKVDNSYVVKIVNVGDKPQDISLTFKGVKALGEGTQILLHHDNLDAYNDINAKTTVLPQTTKVQPTGHELAVTVPAAAFAVYRLPVKK
jgi:alpha-L-arabinofuranosidase